MTTLTILCLLGMLSITVYLLGSISTFGIPPSISDTFYLWDSKKRGLGYLFTAALFSVTFFVTPYWLEVTPDGFRFLAFLGGGALAFVGVASHFLEPDEKPIHYGAAFLWAGASIAWMIVTGVWYLLIPPVVFCGAAWLMSARQNTTFWGEVTVVLALLIALVRTMITG